MLDGKRRTAMVYIMNTEGRGGEYRPLNQPGAWYYATILEGYKVAGFDTDILRQATEDSIEAEAAPYITDTILAQIMEVRKSGVCNMLDTTAVQRYAHDNHLYELVLFIEEHKKAYAHFIFTGERGK